MLHKLINLKELAEILNISYSTLSKDWRQRVVSCNANYINLGKGKKCIPRFRESDVEKMIHNMRAIQN